MPPELNEAEVRQALAELTDPEIGRKLGEIGQLKDVQVSGDKVQLKLALSTWSAPLWKQLRADAVELVQNRFPGAQVEAEVVEHSRPPEKLGSIGLTTKSVIAVGSGKGGVGKSTIASVIALGLHRAGAKVGLVDADVYGPSIPHLFGLEGRPEVVENRIQPVVYDGMKVMSMGFLVPKDQAVVWRGPMLHQAITQFMRDVAWGDLDYLIVDMPPGTGDVALSLSQLLPLTGSVVVCTPQDVALLDAVKAIAMFQKVNIKVLGMVENMSHFACPDCGSKHEIFGHGGARKKANELEVPFLGEVPINIQMRVNGDEGHVAASFDDELVRPYLEAISYNLVKGLAQTRRDEPPMPSLSVL